MIYHIFMGIESDFMYDMFGSLFLEPNNINVPQSFEEYVASLNKFEYYLYRINASKKINKYVKMPFKNRWVDKYINKFLSKVSTNEEVRFIYCYDGIDTIVDNGILEELKKRYSKSKHIFWSADVNYFSKYDVSFLKKHMHSIVVFDEKTAEKSGVLYYPLSYGPVEYFNDKEYQSYDLLFIGGAKKRYFELIRTYKYLTSIGINCGFFVSGVPKNMQMYVGESFYYTYMSHNDCIGYTKSAKCILDINDSNYDNIGLRVTEAVYYNKKVLTNNSAIKKKKYYNNNLMFVYNDLNEISKDFFLNNENCSYTNIEEIKPESFLSFIDSI